MNDDKLIDNALKEHARHMGRDDQGFMDQLEVKLDENAPMFEDKSDLRTEKSSGKAAWMAAVALVMVGATAGALYQMKGAVGSGPVAEPEVLVSYSVSYDVESEPPLPVVVQSKDDAFASNPVVVVKPMMPRPVLVPEDFGIIDSRTIDGVRDGLDLGGGWGDGDDGNGSGGGFQKPLFQQHGDKYGVLIEQGFLSPLKAPLSTFSIDVDKASYTNIRGHVDRGRVIDPNSVRIEEMINYFDYDYPEPNGEHPFTVHTEVASCPWNSKNRLVKIGLKGKEVGGDRKAANLVFLVDVSGSMKSPDKLPLLVSSFEIFLKSLNEKDRVSLVVYAGRQDVLLKPTSIDEAGRQAVRRALQKLSAGGSTNGAAGISTAYDLARSGFIKGGVNRVVLATDGDFNVGITGNTDLLKLVKNQAEGQISLTILGFGQGNLNDHLMEELTNQGDGNYFYLDSLREGQRVFQQKLTGTIETIAKDVKIQVEFNPGKVSRYRLIGYANRRLRNRDFEDDKIDAGDIGSGHSVTALYEVIPVGAEGKLVQGKLKYQEREGAAAARKVIDSPEMLTVKLRYKEPEGEVSTELSEALTDNGKDFKEASADFRFTSSVALWGLLLSDSQYAVDGTIEMVEELALDAMGEDREGERAEFFDLVRKWSSGL